MALAVSSNNRQIWAWLGLTVSSGGGEEERRLCSACAFCSNPPTQPTSPLSESHQSWLHLDQNILSLSFMKTFCIVRDVNLRFG